MVIRRIRERTAQCTDIGEKKRKWMTVSQKLLENSERGDFDM
jgi:hypothetical protein